MSAYEFFKAATANVGEEATSPDVDWTTVTPVDSTATDEATAFKEEEFKEEIKEDDELKVEMKEESLEQIQRDMGGEATALPVTAFGLETVVPLLSLADVAATALAADTEATGRAVGQTRWLPDLPDEVMEDSRAEATSQEATGPQKKVSKFNKSKVSPWHPVCLEDDVELHPGDEAATVSAATGSAATASAASAATASAAPASAATDPMSLAADAEDEVAAGQPHLSTPTQYGKRVTE